MARKMRLKLSFISRTLTKIKNISYFNVEVAVKSNWLDKLVFDPWHLGYLIFLVLINILYITSYYVIPFQIGSKLIFFEQLKYYELAIDFIFLIDMFLRFFASYSTEYGKVSDLKSIVVHYLSNHFLIDWLSLFPGLLTFESYTNVYYFKVLRMFQVKFNSRSEIFYQYIEQKSLRHILKQITSTVLFLKTVFYMLLSIHLFTWVWMFIYNNQHDEDIFSYYLRCKFPNLQI